MIAISKVIDIITRMSNDDNGYISHCLAISTYIRIFDCCDHSVTPREFVSYNSIY